jgi:ribonuclease P/MRP protein subunit RPP1
MPAVIIIRRVKLWRVLLADASCHHHSQGEVMPFYDMCVLVPSQELGKAAEFAKKLGWSGICVLAEARNIKELEASARKVKEIDISSGLLLEPRSTGELKRQVAASRKYHEIIAVKGATLDVARTAAETCGVDLLVEWESGTSKTMDYITAKVAAQNGVHIAFALHPLVVAYEKSRAGIMSRLVEAAGFVRRYRTPFALASCAVSPWDMRSPSELMAFGRVLGFGGQQIKKALGGGMLQENRKRLSGKWVMPGVEVE